MMQNHYEISSKTLFWTQNIQNSIKSHNLDMSGSEKSWFGHVRTWKIVIWTCPDLKNRDLDMSGPEKSWFGHVRTCPRGQVLTSNHRKYFYFFEILHLSIFYDQYLLQNSGNTFFFWDFTPFHFSLANLSVFYKIMCFY